MSAENRRFHSNSRLVPQVAVQLYFCWWLSPTDCLKLDQNLIVFRLKSAVLVRKEAWSKFGKNCCSLKKLSHISIIRNRHTPISLVRSSTHTRPKQSTTNKFIAYQTWTYRSYWIDSLSTFCCKTHSNFYHCLVFADLLLSLSPSLSLSLSLSLSWQVLIRGEWLLE